MTPPKAANTRRRPAKDVASPSATPADRPSLSYLVIGRVIGARGVQGELKIKLETDDPARFHALRQVLMGETHQPFQVQRARVHLGQGLLTLRDIDNRDAAEQWRGALVYVAIENAAALEEGEYFYHQLVGLAVVTVQGEELGTLTEILATGANDVYVVRGSGGELLLPAIKDVIQQIDLEQGRMLVRIPEGLR
ncbi:MAG: ribosome maturation factor RimM [Anaerolineae bacterium]